VKQNGSAAVGQFQKRWHEYVKLKQGWTSAQRSKEKGKIKLRNGIGRGEEEEEEEEEEDEKKREILI
jgi:hypothetical protein